MMRNSIIIGLGIAIVVLFALLQIYLNVGKEADVQTTGSSETAQKTAEAIPLHEQPRRLNPISFTDETGKALDIGTWQGKVVLLNIWATWCVPCREEMPTLDRLQQQLGGTYFEVAALSIDRAGVKVVQRFYDEIGIKHLQIYVDQTMRASGDLGAYGIPTTLLLSPDGQELGRLVGPETWDSPEMIAFLEATITKQFEER